MAQTYNSTYYSNYFKQHKVISITCMYMFFSDMLVVFILKKQQHISDVLYYKDLVYVRIHKTDGCKGRRRQ